MERIERNLEMRQGYKLSKITLTDVLQQDSICQRFQTSQTASSPGTMCSNAWASRDISLSRHHCRRQMQELEKHLSLDMSHDTTWYLLLFYISNEDSAVLDESHGNIWFHGYWFPLCLELKSTVEASREHWFCVILCPPVTECIFYKQFYRSSKLLLRLLPL